MHRRQVLARPAPFARLLHTARLAICGIVVLAASPGLADHPTFRIHFDDAIRQQPYTGRVYLFFSDGQEPRLDLDWFSPQPLVARDVDGLKPGEPVTISLPADDGTLTAPASLDPHKLQGLRVQAVMRFNDWEREVAIGEGNAFSASVAVPANGGSVELVVDRLVPVVTPQDNEWCKLFRLRSERLSDFHQQDVFLQAAVRLPPSYHRDADRRYPVVFEVPGFGGSLPRGWTKTPYSPPTEEGVEFIHVLLDPNSPLGHHVFADSANNGPVGAALVHEFIPAFERSYRTLAAPHGRLLTGHSSGGWSSLWLQITYPETFGGTWSTAPDPVDFRDFQKIDLYATGENMYRDARGERRPIARVGDRPILWYDDFCRIEDVLGHGGQLHSFEAVFSPRGENGQPRLAWNRDTGIVDTGVTESWKKYDIRLVLEQNWPTLGPKLAGKLHVFMGSEDTFYLEGATELLKTSLESLGSDAVVEIHPGKDHSTLMSRELRARITREMSRTVGKAERAPK